MTAPKKKDPVAQLMARKRWDRATDAEKKRVGRELVRARRKKRAARKKARDA